MDGRQIIDTGMVPDTYSDGIAYVENLGTCCRVFFYTFAAPAYGAPLERVIVAKIVRPIASLQSGVISRLLPPATHALSMRGH